MSSATLADIVEILEQLYPPSLAESWDAVGTVTGHPTQQIDKVLFAVDPTDEVVAEAIMTGANLIVSHHPLLLRGVHTVAADTPKGRVIHELISHNIALHCAHTNADSANPGVSDALANAVGVEHTTPIVPRGVHGWDKLVVFVPLDETEKVVEALAAAGAGRLGDYERCVWQTEGEGSFRPLEGANPTIGSVGELERVAEYRVEMLVPRAKRSQVLAAMREAHPYEEVAFDLFEMPDEAGGDEQPSTGLGRIGTLVEPMKLRDFAQRVADALPRTAQGIRVAGDLDRMVQKVAVCGGSGDSELDTVRRLGADVYLTADLRHHPATEALAYEDAPALVDATHWASEWLWLPTAETALKAALQERGMSVETSVSRLVTDAWTTSLGTNRTGEPQ